jgi:hypothetical protein
VGRLTGGAYFEKFVSWGIVSRGLELKTVTIPIFLKSIPGHQTNICSMFQNFLQKKKFKSNICSVIWGGPVDTLPGSDYVKKFHRRFAQFHYKIFVQNDDEKIKKI